MSRQRARGSHAWCHPQYELPKTWDGGLEFEHDHLSAGDAKVSSNCRDRNSLRTDGVLENVRSGPARSVPSVAHVPHLAQFIHEALPQCLSFRIQSLVDALILTGGSLASADDVARLLGVADRFALYRLLRHDGSAVVSKTTVLDKCFDLDVGLEP